MSNQRKEYTIKKIAQINENEQEIFAQMIGKCNQENKYGEPSAITDKEEAYFGSGKLNNVTFQVYQISENCYVLKSIDNPEVAKIVSQIEIKSGKVAGYDGISITRDEKTGEITYTYLDKKIEGTQKAKQLLKINGDKIEFENEEFAYTNPQNIDIIDIESTNALELLIEMQEKRNQGKNDIKQELEGITTGTTDIATKPQSRELYKLQISLQQERFTQERNKNAQLENDKENQEEAIQKANALINELTAELSKTEEELKNQKNKNAKISGYNQEVLQKLKIALSKVEKTNHTNKQLNAFISDITKQINEASEANIFKKGKILKGIVEKLSTYLPEGTEEPRKKWDLGTTPESSHFQDKNQEKGTGKEREEEEKSGVEI